MILYLLQILICNIMKYFFWFMFVCLLSNEVIHAGNLVTVSGKVVDASTNEALPYTTVSLYKNGNTLLLQGTISDDNGIFVFNDLQPGDYTLIFSYIGCEQKTFTFLAGNLNKHLDLGKIKLVQEIASIEEVVIEGKRSHTSNSLSKKSYSLADNFAQANGSVLEAMRNLPGITVDTEGKLLLRGSDKVTVLIDGKRSSLTGFGSQKSLDNIPVSNIERIEIINNPSAKQEAQGMAGIINIIYKKDNQTGLNGNLAFNFGLGELTERKANLPNIMNKYSFTPKYNPSISLNYKKDKINLFLQSDAMFRRKLNSNEFSTRIYPDIIPQNIKSQFLENRSQQLYNIKLGMDWNLTERDVVTLYGLWEDEYHIDKGDVPYDYLIDGNRKRLWQWAEDENTRVMNYNLSYRHQFLQPGRTFEVGMSYSHGSEDELFPFADTAGNNSSADSTHLISKEKNFIFKIDYVHPFRSGRLELGTNIHLRDIPISYRIMPGIFSVLDSHLGEWSDYMEDIYAGYLNYVFESQYIEIESGIRAEYAKVNYKIDPDNQYYNRNESYDKLSLFPNVRLTYKINQRHRLSAFWNRRVDRPEEFDLRPFPKYDDPEILKTGNPYLRPQFTQAFELAYKTNWNSGSFYVAGYYKHIDDIFTRIYTINKDLTVNGITQNLNDGKNWGLEAMLEQSLLKGWDINVGFNWYRNLIEAADGFAIYPNEQSFSFKESKTNSWNIKLNTNLLLPQKTTLQVNFVYYAPDIIPQGKIRSRNSLDLGIRKKAFHDKIEFSLSTTDLLNKSGIRKKIIGDGFILDSQNYYESQTVNIGMKYSF